MSATLEGRDFSNKVVLITGGSTGIGNATAERLAARGATVVLLARSFEERVSKDPRWHCVAADVRQKAELVESAKRICDVHGGLDGLFVNAGIAEFCSVQDADETHFDRLFDTNVKGAFFTTQCFAPLVRRGGSIVFTSSVAAAIGSPWCAVYGASKGAIEAFARSLAAELLEKDIRVNCVSPGPTETPILAKSAVSEAGTAKLAPFVFQRMRMGRLGSAPEIAEAAAFLLGSGSSFITGQTLAVDGGMSGI